MDSLAYSSFFIDNTEAYSSAASMFFVYGIGWNSIMYTMGYVSLLGDNALPAPAPATSQQSPSNVPTITAGSPNEKKSDDMVPLPSIVIIVGNIVSKISTILSSIYSILFGWMHWPACFGPRARFAITAMLTNPMMLTQIFALSIGLIAALRYQFFTPGTVLRPVMQAVEFLASAPIPLGTIITAGNVYHSLIRNYGEDARRLQFAIEKAERELAGDDIAALKPGQRRPRAEEADQELSALGQPNLPASFASSPVRVGAVSSITSGSSDGSGEFKQATDDPFQVPDRMARAPVSVAGAPVLLGIAGAPVSPGDHHIDMTLSASAPAVLDSDPAHAADSELRERAGSPLPSLSAINHTPSLYKPLPNPVAVPATPKDIEFDAEGKPLPLPRLSMLQMLAVSLVRLTVCPLLTFVLIDLAERTYFSFLVGDFHFKVCIMMCSMAPSAETVLMIISKANMMRPSLALSLVYVVEYVMCLVTIPLGLSIILPYYYAG